MADGGARTARIVATGGSTPTRVLTNFDLEKIVDTSDAWILERTGIRERHIAAPDQASSDFAGAATEQALSRAGIAPDEIDALIVATVTPDMLFPSTACVVQKNLGLRRATAFDISAACSGFVFALTIGREYIASGAFKKVVVVGVETLSKIVDWEDRNTCVLFGDGAGAVVLVPSEPGRGILAYHTASDGGMGDLLMQPAGGSRMPATHATVDARLHCVKMAGRDVFKSAVRAMEEASTIALERAGYRASDLSLLIPHQANLRIIEATAERLGVPMEKVFLNLERYGNMSSASIPVALNEAVETGRIRDGDLIELVAFGGGFTWGAVVVRW